LPNADGDATFTKQVVAKVDGTFGVESKTVSKVKVIELNSTDFTILQESNWGHTYRLNSSLAWVAAARYVYSFSLINGVQGYEVEVITKLRFNDGESPNSTAKSLFFTPESPLLNINFITSVVISYVEY
jgi:hypothetical protein